MAVAKRTGPDFLFLANAHSQKFNDLENGPPEANVTFLNSSNQDWVSVTGECVTSDNSDPRIKEIWSKGTKAWFGDLGDGVHTGGPEDPRMKLIEIRAKCGFRLIFLDLGGLVVDGWVC
jgi:general stress protein 26